METNNLWLIINRIIHVRYKYLKPFNCVQKKMSLGLFKNIINEMFTNHIYLTHIYK